MQQIFEKTIGDVLADQLSILMKFKLNWKRDHMKKIILLIPKISYEEVKSIYEKLYKNSMSKQDLEKTFNPF